MADLASLVSRLEAVASRLEASGGAGGGAAPASGGAAGGSASVDGYQAIVDGSFKTFMDLSASIGGDVATQAAMVQKAFNAQLAFIVMASKSKQPAQTDLPALLKETSDAIAEICAFQESNRRSKQSNHLSVISSSIPALGWVTISPKPCPFIKEMRDAGMFYLNRVIKEFKDTDKSQVEWARAFGATLQEMHDYVKSVHTTGLVWNKSGADAKVPASAPAAAAPKKAAAPVQAAAPGSDAKGGLFAALNKGGGVTSGLKKVDRSQMTHKNPELRAGSKVEAGAVKAKAAPKKFGGPVVAKDPVHRLVGKKWEVEHQKGNNELVIEGNMKQTVYVYKCEHSTLVIKGKVNSITVDSCKKFAVVFDSAMAAFEMVNCQGIQVQVNGNVPTVSIDKTDGAQVYLSKESMGTQIVSAKSSEMNVLVPTGADGEFEEAPLPEQYRSVFKDGKWFTEPTDIAG